MESLNLDGFDVIFEVIFGAGRNFSNGLELLSVGVSVRVASARCRWLQIDGARVCQERGRVRLNRCT